MYHFLGKSRRNAAEYLGELRNSRKLYRIIIGPAAGGMSKAENLYIEAESQQEAATRAKRQYPGWMVYSITAK